jgi:hypothetical protein
VFLKSPTPVAGRTFESAGVAQGAIPDGFAGTDAGNWHGVCFKAPAGPETAVDLPWKPQP